MSTPESRQAQLAAVYAQRAVSERDREEREHLPGGGATVFERVGFWEVSYDHADAAWDAIDREATAALVNAGPRPEPEIRAEVVRLRAEKDRRWAERERCRTLRDAALAELALWADPDSPAGLG
jgi:hypothetical protein